VKPVILLVVETRGGLSQKIRGLINLCATLAESNAAPGFNPKLKAELTSKFMYNIVSTIWLNNADMIVKIPQGIQHNAKRLVDVAGPAPAASVPGLEHPPSNPHPHPLDPPSLSLVASILGGAILPALSPRLPPVPLLRLAWSLSFLFNCYVR
jgi:hypothetical protein